MQSLAPLVISDLLETVTEPLIKIEVYSGGFSPFAAIATYGSELYGAGTYGQTWIDLGDLAGIDGDILETLSLSIATAKKNPKPVAAKWSAVLFNQDALFLPDHPTSEFTELFTIGRKIKLWIGIKVNGTDYWWQQILGVMNQPKFTGKTFAVNVEGFDYTQVLIDTKFASPDNYFGTTTTESTVAAQYEYGMPGGCTGIHFATWDGAAIYNGNDWTYDSGANEFVFNADKTILNGVNNLVIHYYTQQVPEEVIADILVLAGLYDNQVDALAAMDYTATGLTIDRVWFKSGDPMLSGIKMLSERANYRFYFGFDGTPVFKPKPSAKAAGNEDLQLTQNQISKYESYENDSELFNHITIEGEEQDSPIWKEDAQPNKLEGSSIDAGSVDLIGEKMWPIKNHLFQDQATIDNMCDTYLAEFKDKKRYIAFNLEFSPIPLEIWDTVRIQVRLTPVSGYGSKYNTFKYGDGTKYGSNGIVISQRGIVRDIKINKFSNRIILERVT